MDIDASSFNKSVNVDLKVQGDLTKILKLINQRIEQRKVFFNKNQVKDWWSKINKWRSRDCLKYRIQIQLSNLSMPSRDEQIDRKL